MTGPTPLPRPIPTPAAPTAGPAADPTRFGTDAFYAAIGRAFVALCAAVPALWLIELLDLALGHVLDRVGAIVPREVSGIDGIVLAPFLHLGFGHLAANSVPLVLLGTFVLAGQTRRFLAVTAFVALVSGAVVWLVSDAPVVGASGVVFGYLGYLLARGVVERQLWSVAVAVLAGLLFGWQISGVLPGDPSVSWQGHLSGFIAGIVAAILFRRRRPAKAATAPAAAGLPKTG
jgi:membrane associated rhomboid family serine protease